MYVIDITFCGDWAGNDYATSGCPGTCPERLMDPTNYNVSLPLVECSTFLTYRSECHLGYQLGKSLSQAEHSYRCECIWC